MTTRPDPSVLTVHPEVAEAVAAGRPVVALESTIISHGLPRPANLEIAARIEEVVRAEGAVPATIAIVDGRVCVGLDEAQLDAIAMRDDVIKVSVRDVATLVARRGMGATTVASTSHIALLAGHRRLRDRRARRRPPGGAGLLGRVRRPHHARRPADHGRLQRREVDPRRARHARAARDPQHRRRRLRHGPVPRLLPHRLRSRPGLAGREPRRRWPRSCGPAPTLGIAAGLVVANPLAESDALDPDLHDRVLRGGLAAAGQVGVRGKDVTPFLLDYFHRETAGASLEANVAIILGNAALAARIAVAHARLGAGAPIPA